MLNYYDAIGVALNIWEECPYELGGIINEFLGHYVTVYIAENQKDYINGRFNLNGMMGGLLVGSNTIGELYFVDEDGKRVSGFDKLSAGRFVGSPLVVFKNHILTASATSHIIDHKFLEFSAENGHGNYKCLSTNVTYAKDTFKECAYPALRSCYYANDKINVDGIDLMRFVTWIFVMSRNENCGALKPCNNENLVIKCDFRKQYMNKPTSRYINVNKFEERLLCKRHKFIGGKKITLILSDETVIFRSENDLSMSIAFSIDDDNDYANILVSYGKKLKFLFVGKQKITYETDFDDIYARQCNYPLQESYHDAYCVNGILGAAGSDVNFMFVPANLHSSWSYQFDDEKCDDAKPNVILDEKKFRFEQHLECS